MSDEVNVLRSELNLIRRDYEKLVAQAAEEKLLAVETRKARIGQLHEIYRQEMVQGRELQFWAWLWHNEAEGASTSYVSMREEFRKRHGSDGYGNATNDYRYSQYSEAQKAGKDNGWYMIRAQTAAQLAAMHFAKATAIQAEIHRLQLSG